MTRRLADTSRAREILGFEATVDIEEGLTGLVNWWRADLEQPGGSALTVAA